jgi:hypothetical protein
MYSRAQEEAAVGALQAPKESGRTDFREFISGLAARRPRANERGANSQKKKGFLYRVSVVNALGC